MTYRTRGRIRATARAQRPAIRDQRTTWPCDHCSFPSSTPVRPPPRSKESVGPEGCDQSQDGIKNYRDLLKISLKWGMCGAVPYARWGTLCAPVFRDTGEAFHRHERACGRRWKTGSGTAMEAIPDAGLGEDELRSPGIALQLAAQVIDIDVQVVRLRPIAVAPHLP